MVYYWYNYLLFFNMKKYLFIFILVFLAAGSLFFSIAPLEAKCQAGAADCSLTNPLGDIDTPQALIGQIINSVLGVVGSLALLMFVYGGLTWMTSSGNQEKVKKGRDILIWSAIGLAIIFASYGLVKVLITGVRS